MSTYNDEKYVSIDYDKWESFYKPLEAAYKEVCKELEKEKEKKIVRIRLAWNTYREAGNYYGRHEDVGTIDTMVQTEAGCLIGQEGRHVIKRQVENILSTTSIFGGHGKRVFVNTCDFIEAQDRLKKEKEEVQSWITAFEIVKREADASVAELKKERAAIVIPRIVKWFQKLFGHNV